MKQWLWMLIGLLVLSLLGAALYVVGNHLMHTSSTLARKLGAPLPVRVAVAKQTHLTQTVGASGAVQPLANLDLTAALSARVDKVAVDVGDLVAPRQELLRFDRDLLQAALTAAQSVLDQAIGDQQRAAQYLRRIATIYQQGLLPKVDVERAQAAVDEAHAKYNQARERLVRARRDLQDAALTSPVSAIVMERLINDGETPRAAQKVFTLGRIDQVLVVSNIAEERLEEITLGQTATVTLMAFPNDEFAGTVVKVKPVTDPKTRTFLVYTKVANPGLKLKPGLTAFTRFQRQHDVLAVPSVSLINPTGIQESTVFVLENGSTARLRKVRVGVVAEGMTEVRSGLTAGEQVIVVGQIALRDGDQVIIGDEFRELREQMAHKRQEERCPIIDGC
jgi:RND family efflux transporter MFP subunit